LLEYVLVKVLLQLFICKVDAKLLEVIEFKRFKAVDIKHADARGCGLILANCCIDCAHQPVKHLGVDNLCKRIPSEQQQQQRCQQQ
jgi:hypothetical protein